MSKRTIWLSSSKSSGDMGRIKVGLGLRLTWIHSTAHDLSLNPNFDRRSGTVHTRTLTMTNHTCNLQEANTEPAALYTMTMLHVEILAAPR